MPQDFRRHFKRTGTIDDRDLIAITPYGKPPLSGGRPLSERSIPFKEFKGEVLEAVVVPAVPLDHTLPRIGITTFPDIASAVAAATANQTIVIPTGTYTVFNMLSGMTDPSVSFTCERGVTLTATTETTRAMFDTSAGAGAHADGWKGKLLGFPKIKLVDKLSYAGFCRFSNALDDVYVEAQSVSTVTSSDRATVLWLEHGKVEVNVLGDMADSLIGASGVVYAYGPVVAKVTAGSITGHTYTAITSSNGADLTVYVKDITSTSANALQTFAACKLTCFFDTIVSSSTAISNADGNEMYLEGRKIITSGPGLSMLVSGVFTMKGVDILNSNDTGSIMKVYVAGVVALFEHCRFESNTDGYMAELDIGDTTFKDCTFYNTRSLAGSHIIGKNAGILTIMYSRLIQAHAGSFPVLDIPALGSQNVKSMASYSNATALDANTTSLIEAINLSPEVGLI